MWRNDVLLFFAAETEECMDCWREREWKRVGVVPCLIITRNGGKEKIYEHVQPFSGVRLQERGREEGKE